MTVAATLLSGDCRAVLPTLGDGAFQCCVTSPPYWGLRDYGVEGQIGQEKTPAEYVDAIVRVFREVHRVLAEDGTLWLNLGDSYAAGKCGRDDDDEANLRRRFEAFGTGRPKAGKKGANGKGCAAPPGFKPKDLVGIPWRVAFALQNAGWYLRQEIIWHKLNPMPESVKDRPTRSHEQIFLFAKSERYFYDADAIAEPATSEREERSRPNGLSVAEQKTRGGTGQRVSAGVGETRNARSVWAFASEAVREAHFATFPSELPKRCILAGSKVGDAVLDPFGGSGTVGRVAVDLGRSATMIELNPDYAKIASRRSAQTGLGL